MELVVALLRSVNIGKRQLPMAVLRAGLEVAGCTNVVTYVQSGNVVLTPPSRQRARLRTWLEGVIGELAGFEVPVIVRSALEMSDVVAYNPYPHASGAQLHVTFYADQPSADTLHGVNLAGFPPEHGTLVGRDLYLHLPSGMGRAELPAALERAGKRKASTPATTRNWNTVVKLVELSRDAAQQR